MIRVLEVEISEFQSINNQITELLIPFDDFTSITWQENIIESINGKALIFEPKKEKYIEAIKPLNLNFQDAEKSIIKVYEPIINDEEI